MQLINRVRHINIMRFLRNGYDRLWDWMAYQMRKGWHVICLSYVSPKIGLCNYCKLAIFCSWSYLERPYELAKAIVFWSILVIITLWVLYYISVALYLLFYYFAVAPPATMHIRQPLNLKYPDKAKMEHIYAYHCIEPIEYPQAYNWRLKLRLPENPNNFDAGVFMARLMLLPPVGEDSYQAKQNTTGWTNRERLVRQTRTALEHRFEPKNESELDKLERASIVGEKALMLRYKPATYKWILNVIYTLPRMVIDDWMGIHLFDEIQTMEVDLISDHSAIHSIQGARTSHQCFVFTINNPDVQLYDAEIHATAILRGWRYFCYYWFWTAFFFGSLIIYGFLIGSIISIVLGVIIKKAIYGELLIPDSFFVTFGKKRDDSQPQMKRKKSREGFKKPVIKDRYAMQRDEDIQKLLHDKKREKEAKRAQQMPSSSSHPPFHSRHPTSSRSFEGYEAEDSAESLSKRTKLKHQFRDISPSHTSSHPSDRHSTQIPQDERNFKKRLASNKSAHRATFGTPESDSGYTSSGSSGSYDSTEYPAEKKAEPQASSSTNTFTQLARDTLDTADEAKLSLPSTTHFSPSVVDIAPIKVPRTTQIIKTEEDKEEPLSTPSKPTTEVHVPSQSEEPGIEIAPPSPRDLPLNPDDDDGIGVERFLERPPTHKSESEEDDSLK